MTVSRRPLTFGTASTVAAPIRLPTTEMLSVMSARVTDGQFDRHRQAGSAEAAEAAQPAKPPPPCAAALTAARPWSAVGARQHSPLPRRRFNVVGSPRRRLRG